ncbi:Ger(x)C family spore germination protein [Paenibacillus sp. IB182496]|uniref:Ger(X)C family spore germination protein n=1 Tax=Paenibacillus sabuli TaxID=2772509 RepID=A0A927BUH2_9BACL|nr:Ger(x)C family spore germination protein [Paenibacillus sabuli]MBD2845618.1 Ger(x)C family spore germination protein [Paenibacillus sabuli]
MQRKRQALILLCLCVLGLAPGCWDSRELNELAITVGLGLDKSGDNVKVTTQIVNPGEVASKQGNQGNRMPFTTISSTEQTVIEALRKQTIILPRAVFTSHLRILVIGEELARDGILKVMDGLSRNREMRSDFYIIVARDAEAEDILATLTPMERISAYKMFKTLEMSAEEWAPTVDVEMDQLLHDLANPLKDTVLAGMVIEGNKEVGSEAHNLDRSKPFTSLVFSGLALFRDDKLVDWLNSQESKGYNYIMNNVDTTAGHLACPDGDGFIAMEVTHAKSSINGSVDQEGEPFIDLSFQLEENVGEAQCEMDLSDTASLERLERVATRQLEEIVRQTIAKAQRNKADIFGFGERIEDAAPREWLRLKDDWRERFAKLKVNIEVDLKVRRIGTTINPLSDRKE